MLKPRAISGPEADCASECTSVLAYTLKIKDKKKTVRNRLRVMTGIGCQKARC
jgi:hypothetical protein